MSYHDDDETKDQVEDEESHDSVLDIDEAFDEETVDDDSLFNDDIESLESLYEEEDDLEKDFLSDDHEDGNY